MRPEPHDDLEETMNVLELYYLPTCPYSLKVLNFLEKNGISIELKSTTEPENRDTLLEVGKKNQVPCLFIDGKPLYESDDIIAYLRERFVA
jgi:glutathione S-transferase